MNPLRRGMLALCLGAWLAVPANAGDLAPGTGWHEAHATLLDVDFGDSGFRARWQFHHCACGDLLVRFEQTAPGEVDVGELLVLERRLVLARGRFPDSPDLASTLQAPALMVQLAFGLLQRAVPGGPAAVAAAQDFDLIERNADMTVETGMADGHFAAPWQVTGKAWMPAEGLRRFDFSFAFRNPLPDAPGGLTRISFTGGQDYLRDDFPLREETPMAGWKLQWLDREDAGVEEPAEGATLGELRQLARESVSKE